MLHNLQVRQVHRLSCSGFSVQEIAALTGFDFEDVQAAADHCPRRLQRTAERWLSCTPPRWWHGSVSAFRHCVRMNFADVLQ